MRAAEGTSDAGAGTEGTGAGRCHRAGAAGPGWSGGTAGMGTVRPGWRLPAETTHVTRSALASTCVDPVARRCCAVWPQQARHNGRKCV